MLVKQLLTSVSTDMI